MSDPLVAAGSNLQPTVFVRLLHELKVAQRAIDSATGTKRAILKRCKSAGVHLEAMALVQRLAKMDDDEAELLMATTIRYAAWSATPIGTQADLFASAADVDQETADAQSEFAADDAGFKAGKAAREIDSNPYPAGSAEFDRWRRAWQQGQAANAPAQAAPDAEDSADEPQPQPTAAGRPGKPAGRGRGRPPKAAAPAAPPPRTGKQTGRRKQGAESRMN